MNSCDKCGYRHGGGRCCIDIYQQLGQYKGPSVVPKLLLAFVLPLLIFLGVLILAEYLLAVVMEGYARTLTSYLAAIISTVLFVQVLRIFTRKPVDMEKHLNKRR